MKNYKLTRQENGVLREYNISGFAIESPQSFTIEDFDYIKTSNCFFIKNNYVLTLHKDIKYNAERYLVVKVLMEDFRRAKHNDLDANLIIMGIDMGIDNRKFRLKEQFWVQDDDPIWVNLYLEKLNHD